MDNMHITGAQYTPPMTVGASMFHNIAEGTASVSTNDTSAFPPFATGSTFTCKGGDCGCMMQIVFKTVVCDNPFDD